jgi:transposase
VLTRCAQPPRDDREDLIERQEREITRLRNELARAEQQRREAERERDRLKRQNERLKQQLDAARRAGFRQAAPFAKNRPQGRGGRPGRRAGATYGRRARRVKPQRVDERYTAALPPACPDCGGALHLTRVATQYQEDLPVVRPVVRHFEVHVGCCTKCGRRVQGRHPLQTSDALGAANVHVGPGAVTFIVLMHTQFGVPLQKITTVLRERFGLTVTAGGVAQILHRAARQSTPTYAALCEQVRGSPMVSADETGWRLGAAPHWLWVFATPDTTVYSIRPGRSFDDAAAILDPAFDGVLVRDGWAPYRQFAEALHQTCVTHLVRRCRTLREDHPRSPWAADVQEVLQASLALRDRRDAHEISTHGLTVARGRLLARLGALIDSAPALPAAQRFAAHLTTEFPAVLTFLWEPGIDATNWRAEHAIRPAVVARKICGGNRTRRGADTQQVLASVIRTARQRCLDLTAVFTTLLRAARPIVPIVFQDGIHENHTR